MHLTQNEEKALNGEEGEAVATAYQILTAIGKLTDATRLITIAHAHVSGASYMTIGEAGLQFLESFSSTARTKVFTTVNPCSIDLQTFRQYHIPTDYVDKQLQIVNSYRRIGVTESFTCTPYEGFDLPPKGSHISWSESSAAIYANSMLGLRTNRESGLSALASAVTGKTPYSGLHRNEYRRPKLIVRVQGRLVGTMDYSLLGYFAGKLTDQTLGFSGIDQISKEEAKSLSAGIGTVGASGMFVLVKQVNNAEVIDYTSVERDTLLSEFEETTEGDTIVFGCPQMLTTEVKKLAAAIGKKKFRRRCIIFCSRRVYDEALARGYVNKIKNAGGEFLRDSCADFTPVLRELDTEGIVTDTCKAAHYIKRVHGIKVSLKSTEEILKEYLQ